MENEQARSAQEALASVEGARASAADRLVTPWWYHVALGLLVSGLVVLMALAPLPVLLAGLALYGIGLGVLVQTYKNKAGVWRSGLAGGKASTCAYVLMGVYFVCVAVAVGFGRLGDKAWPVWLAAAAMLVATVVLGRQYDAELRSDMRSRP